MRKVYSEMAGEMMSERNASIHSQLVKLELATLECEQMGIEVEYVEWFDIGKPRLVVRDNAATRHFVKTGKAHNYGSEVKNGIRVALNQMQVKGVKIIWKSDFIQH